MKQRFGADRPDCKLAEELTRDLLEREPDLAGFYISGGGKLWIDAFLVRKLWKLEK